MKTGFVGLGLMGARMALNLRKKGFDVVVHNRTASKAEGVLSAGATWADSPAGAAEDAGMEYQWEEFDVPPNLETYTIDRKTGLLATPVCLFPIIEYFLPGKVPDRFCSYDDHMLTYDYYEALAKEKEQEE